MKPNCQPGILSPKEKLPWDQLVVQQNCLQQRFLWWENLVPDLGTSSLFGMWSQETKRERGKGEKPIKNALNNTVKKCKSKLPRGITSH